MHDMDPEQVTFHEVGALDSIVDIVGACIGLEWLGRPTLRSGPLALGGEGGAYVPCAHGLLPIPAFATLELVKGLPTRACPVAKELTTPTGAALVKALVESWGPLPPMRVNALGYGAGTRNDPAIPVPNLLRLALGDLTDQAAASAAAPQDECDEVVEIEANLDDCTPEVLGHVQERLLAQGALDVLLQPAYMKKGRPATRLTVLAEPSRLSTLADLLFEETSTFGLRYQVKHRLKLARHWETMQTPWGAVRVKVGSRHGRVLSAEPEYEDARAAASAHDVPLKDVLAYVRGRVNG
jgi:uncharacterized protein (TIGR00299 family) protein